MHDVYGLLYMLFFDLARAKDLRIIKIRVQVFFRKTSVSIQFLAKIYFVILEWIEFLAIKDLETASHAKRTFGHD